MDNTPINTQHINTLSGLFMERVRLTPDKPAYRQFDPDSQNWIQYSWKQMSVEVGRWQTAFIKEGLQAGDRVSIMLRNCREWVTFDQAAMGLGLVTVPLYGEDRADNVAYILNHSDAKFILLQDANLWEQIASSNADLSAIRRVVCLQSSDTKPDQHISQKNLVTSLDNWLFGLTGEIQSIAADPASLTSIVYTSGTTGRSKGVMLSHKNILGNAIAASQCQAWGDNEVFLSFLPLSHMLERTAGYYLAMLVGGEVAYARSIPQLGEDLMSVRPTVLISVPRIYERVYCKIRDGLETKSPVAQSLFKAAVNVGWTKFEFEQGRSSWHPKLLLWPILKALVAGKVLAKLGGRLQLAICGGAPLSEQVAKLFIGLGLPLVQGYGLTESSPVIAVNRVNDNIPHSIGLPLPGIKVRIADKDELQSFSDATMLGYWKNEQATRDTMTPDGWLKTGDKARIDKIGHLYITGRLKDIIVLANGEKLPPSDMELAISLNPLIDQVIVIGEGMPYLSALVVLNPEAWKVTAKSLGLSEDASSLRNPKVEEFLLRTIGSQLHAFPGYAQIRRVSATLEPWTIDNGLITPTMKTKREKVMSRYRAEIDCMYEGHCR
ncbi:MAG: long-chain fatty acid--CoA ligase [Gammaproteobacteria bacterium]|nr:long-chain fatty acid--CoA ligase [Gammaproteobacteria bacterium]